MIGRLSLVVASFCLCTQGFADDTLAAPDLHLQTAIEKSLKNQAEKAIPAARAARQAEPQSRLAHWLEAQAILVPANILSFGRQLDIGRYLLLADLSVSRIYVFDIAAPKPLLVREIYSSIGVKGPIKTREGDRRTPIGVYRLLKEIRNPRADGFLGDLAITLDYPNAEDRRARRTGSGIWIHGVPHEVHVRPPRSSDGCLAISNTDMLTIREFVEYGTTHIVIVPKVEWLARDDWDIQRRKTLGTLPLSKSLGALEGQAVFFIAQDRPIVSIARKDRRLTRAYWAQGQGRSPLLIEEL